MANVLVRNIPDDIHLVLRRRAELKGLSLQQYLSAELKRLATKPSLEEVLDGIDRQRGGRVGFEQAAEDVSDERGHR